MMQSNPNLKKNFMLSTAYQILTMLMPLITAPYISRILGASGVGIYSYTHSIATYFSMAAALGTASYGAREIARNRNNRELRSKLFWEIELLTVLTGILCMVLWGIWIAVCDKYEMYYKILTFCLVATMADISWFYTGLEQFKYTVIQNTLFKIIGIGALFLFVRDKEDVAAYVAIMSLTTLLGNLSMWVYLPGFIDKVEIKSLRIFPHFKETLVYFVPTIATSVYTILDKTLVGIITQDASQNGYYEQATKIINMCKTVTFTALNSVLGARLSYLYAEGKYGEIKRRINQSMDYILFMGIGICVGLICVSNKFVPTFFGEGYEEVISLLKMLSPLVIIIGVSNCLGSQYYTPAGLRKQSAHYIIIGSLVNLVLNLLFIPCLKSNGAALATLIAESVISVLYISKSKKMVSAIDLLRYLWKKIAAAIVMMIVIKLTGNLPGNDPVILAIQVLFGGMAYVITLYLIKDSFISDYTVPVVRRWLNRNSNVGWSRDDKKN